MTRFTVVASFINKTSGAKAISASGVSEAVKVGDRVRPPAKFETDDEAQIARLSAAGCLRPLAKAAEAPPAPKPTEGASEGVAHRVGAVGDGVSHGDGENSRPEGEGEGGTDGAAGGANGGSDGSEGRTEGSADEGGARTGSDPSEVGGQDGRAAGSRAKPAAGGRGSRARGKAAK